MSEDNNTASLRRDGRKIYDGKWLMAVFTHEVDACLFENLIAQNASRLPDTGGLSPISEDTPKDRKIIVYCPEREGLPELVCFCQWHPDAGFCVDELRHPTHWAEIPQ